MTDVPTLQDFLFLYFAGLEKKNKPKADNHETPSRHLSSFFACPLLRGRFPQGLKNKTNQDVFIKKSESQGNKKNWKKNKKIEMRLDKINQMVYLLGMRGNNKHA